MAPVVKKPGATRSRVKKTPEQQRADRRERNRRHARWVGLTVAVGVGVGVGVGVVCVGWGKRITRTRTRACTHTQLLRCRTFNNITRFQHSDLARYRCSRARKKLLIDALQNCIKALKSENSSLKGQIEGRFGAFQPTLLTFGETSKPALLAHAPTHQHKSARRETSAHPLRVSPL